MGTVARQRMRGPGRLGAWGSAALVALAPFAGGCSRVDASVNPDEPEQKPAGETNGPAAPGESKRLSRIVSAGGNVTETLFALGLGDRVVAVDTTSVYPESATRLPQVGYLRRLSGEGILSLRPSLFIGTEDAEPESVLEQLRRAGVGLSLITSEPGLDAAYERVRRVGRAVDRAREAEQLVSRMQAEMQRLERAIARVEQRPRVLFVYARGQGTAQVAGRDTSAQMMIELSGGRNAVDAFEGYRPLTSEAVLMADPDYLLMPEKGLESLDGVEGLLAQPGIAQTRAGRERRVIAIDDSRLLGFGPRVASAVSELARRLHPGLPGIDAP